MADNTKAAGAGSLRKSHDIVILSFCNIVKGQANQPIKMLKFGKLVMGNQVLQNQLVDGSAQ